MKGLDGSGISNAGCSAKSSFSLENACCRSGVHSHFVVIFVSAWRVSEPVQEGLHKPVLRRTTKTRSFSGGRRLRRTSRTHWELGIILLTLGEFHTVNTSLFAKLGIQEGLPGGVSHCYILSLLAQDTFFMTNPFSLSSRFGPSILGHCTIVSSDSSSFRACTAFYLSSDPNPMFSDFSSFRFRPWTLIYSSSGSILPKRTSIGPLCTATRTFYPSSSVFYSGLFLLGSLPVQYLNSSPSEGAT